MVNACVHINELIMALTLFLSSLLQRQQVCEFPNVIINTVLENGLKFISFALPPLSNGCTTIDVIPCCNFGVILYKALYIWIYGTHRVQPAVRNGSVCAGACAGPGRRQQECILTYFE